MELQRSLAISANSNNHGPLVARKAFGRLTHAAQDFYAHSNYISLWVNLHQGLNASDIDPLDPEILTSPALRSGRIYYPVEALTFLPGVGRIFRYLLPRDAHAWMNLDSPASGALFEYARYAAIKRTGIEFNLLSSQLLERSGPGFEALFTGMIESMG
jgi:hypothetical protein